MSPGSRTHTARTQAWRLTTAVRVFGLAFVLGVAASRDSLGDVVVVLVGLATLAIITAASELRSFGAEVRWTPIVESLIVVSLLGASQYDPSLAPYLLVPPVVAGARHGLVPATNAGLVGLLALAAGILTVVPVDVAETLSGNLSWAVVGWAAGLLAGWQTRSRRQLEEQQAPYAAANALLNELHDLVGKHSVELDPVFVARRLSDQLTERGAPPLTVAIVDQGGGLEPLAGAVPDGAHQSLHACLDSGRPHRFAGGRCQPLPLGRHVAGVVVFAETPDDAAVTPLLQEGALRLETALRFRQVRRQATTDERRRLSREIHDGVSQEIVALGYLVDELVDGAASPAGRDVAVLLRREIDRVLNDLRSSVHTWRSQSEVNPLPAALRTVVESFTRSRELVVQLNTTDVPGLPGEVQDELLGIAKEAIANARKHALATHLWVSLAPDDVGVRLRVEDDGVGGATAVPGHFGMHTMQERAERIGAQLLVSPRTGGGTKVAVTWSSRSSAMGGSLDDVHAVAGR